MASIAEQIVAELLEPQAAPPAPPAPVAPTEAVCAWCEQQFNIPKSSGSGITHGICRRHFMKQLVQMGKTGAEISAKIKGQTFAPDMAAQQRQAPPGPPAV